jgi:hypothetical protein
MTLFFSPLALDSSCVCKFWVFFNDDTNGFSPSALRIECMFLGVLFFPSLFTLVWQRGGMTMRKGMEKGTERGTEMESQREMEGKGTGKSKEKGVTSPD